MTDTTNQQDLDDNCSHALTFIEEWDQKISKAKMIKWFFLLGIIFSAFNILSISDIYKEFALYILTILIISIIWYRRYRKKIIQFPNELLHEFNRQFPYGSAQRYSVLQFLSTREDNKNKVISFLFDKIKDFPIRSESPFENFTGSISTSNSSSQQDLDDNCRYALTFIEKWDQKIGKIKTIKKFSFWGIFLSVFITFIGSLNNSQIIKSLIGFIIFGFIISIVLYIRYKMKDVEFLDEFVYDFNRRFPKGFAQRYMALQFLSTQEDTENKAISILLDSINDFPLLESDSLFENFNRFTFTSNSRSRSSSERNHWEANFSKRSSTTYKNSGSQKESPGTPKKPKKMRPQKRSEFKDNKKYMPLDFENPLDGDK